MTNGDKRRVFISDSYIIKSPVPLFYLSFLFNLVLPDVFRDKEIPEGEIFSSDLLIFSFILLLLCLLTVFQPQSLIWFPTRELKTFCDSEDLCHFYSPHRQHRLNCSHFVIFKFSHIFLPLQCRCRVLTRGTCWKTSWRTTIGWSGRWATTPTLSPLSSPSVWYRSWTW